MSGLGTRGYFTVARFRGAPVRIHWTTPIGAYFFCGMGIAPVAWTAFLLLILAHEIGHAILVKKYGLAVLSIDLHALGGACVYRGTPNEVTRAKIAWGGIVAQVAILIVASWLPSLVPHSHLLTQIVQTWTAANLLLIALNLLPIAPLDGAEAWRLFRPRNIESLWKKSGREGDLRRQARILERELARIRNARPEPPRSRDDSMLH